jgi:hypothetical protein
MEVAFCFNANFLLNLFFESEDYGVVFDRNVG